MKGFVAVSTRRGGLGELPFEGSARGPRRSEACGRSSPRNTGDAARRARRGASTSRTSATPFLFRPPRPIANLDHAIDGYSSPVERPASSPCGWLRGRHPAWPILKNPRSRFERIREEVQAGPGRAGARHRNF